MSISPETFYAPHPTPIRGHGLFLSSDEKTDSFAYCVDNLIYIHGLTNQFDVDLYAGHPNKTTTCAYSPNGRWIASADELGNVKLWSPQNADKPLELESRLISGPVYDITWTGDSQRLSIVGLGANDAHGGVISADTASPIGEVMGHTKRVNTGALKPNRPFRFVSGGDDAAHVFYKGPPFKFDHTCRDHEKFVFCTRFAPDGSVFATTGLDGKVIIYEGKDGGKLNEFRFPCGVTTIAFSPDSKQGLLSLNDGRALVINIADGSVAEEYVIGTNLYQQQLGALWNSKHKMTVSLNGDFNFLEGEGKVRTERGHTSSVVAMALFDGGIATGDVRGTVLFRKFGENPYAVWRPEGFDGNAPNVNCMTTNKDRTNILLGCGDYKIYVLTTDATLLNTIDIGKTIKNIIPFGDDYIVLIPNAILLLKDGQIKDIPTPFPPATAAVHPNATEIVIGGAKGAMAIIAPDGKILEQNNKAHDRDVVTLAYSRDGERIASSSVGKDIAVWNRSNMKESLHEGWRFHSLAITKILFSDDGNHLFTISGDRTIRQWSLEKKRKYVVVERAHQQKINDVAMLDEKHIVTISDDGAIRTWTVELI